MKRKNVWLLLLAVFIVMLPSCSLSEEKQDIEYTEVTVDELYEAINDNPLNAKDTYMDAYVAVTGTLMVIDSDGEYIAIYSMGYSSLDNVHCVFVDDSQLEKVKTLSIGDTITVKGKMIDVDGIFTYKMTVDSIED